MQCNQADYKETRGFAELTKITLSYFASLFSFVQDKHDTDPSQG